MDMIHQGLYPKKSYILPYMFFVCFFPTTYFIVLCYINSYQYIQHMDLKNNECLINIKKYYTLFSNKK